ANDVIPIRPGTISQVVGLVALTLSKTRHVQPVATPAFAIVRGGQQPIDQLLVRIDALILEERFHFFGRGRQPEQVKRRASDERSTVGGRGGLKSFIFQLVKNKTVNRSRPVR